MKVYIVGGNLRYLTAIHNAVHVTNMQDADLVIFTGGSDISPRLYGELPHKLTMIDAKRDKEEVTEMLLAVKLKKPILGICRGAQFGCAASGGKLVQHVVGQKFIHTVYDKNFGTIEVNSMHHQLMYPFNLPEKDYKLLAYSEELIDTWEGLPSGIKVKPDVEPEIVYFRKTNILGVQGHPERADAPKEYREIVTHYAKQLVNGKL